MVTDEWTRSRISFGSPLSSRPKTSATFPLGAASSSSIAATFGSMIRSLAARRRAVNPTTRTQSATAASNESKCSIRSMRSIVPCAIPSRRTTSYSTGRTSRRRLAPMFFIARIVAAMLTGSCGSYSTTTTDTSNESAIDDLERNQACGVVAIALQIHEFAGSAAQDELSPASLTSERRLVHDDVDSERWPRLIDLDGDPVALAAAFPPRVDRQVGRPTFDPARADRVALSFGDEKPAAVATSRSKVELHTVAVDVRWLVIVRVGR